MKKKYFQFFSVVVILMYVSERLFFMFHYGVQYNIASDDVSYINSGIELFRSGRLIMHGVLSAQIMPLMSIITGLPSIIFSVDSLNYWFILKLIYLLMSIGSAIGIYQILKLFVNKWWSVLGIFFLMTPDFVWMDSLVLTETPFMLGFIWSIYFLLLLEKSKRWKHLFLLTFWFMWSFLLKANFGIFPIFIFGYLLIKKYPKKKWFANGLVMLFILLSFIVPWTVRNYNDFDHFIPLTYGSGNPKLLGTYQGTGYPSEKLDSKFNVEIQSTFDKLRAKYYNHGKYDPKYMEIYFNLEHDGLLAKRRIHYWWQHNPTSLIYSYLVYKPILMMNSTFLWVKLPFFTIGRLNLYRAVLNIGAFILLVVVTYTRKTKIKELWMFYIIYLTNIYIYSLTFAFSRYAQTLVFLPAIIVIIAGFKLIQWIEQKRKGGVNDDNSQ